MRGALVEYASSFGTSLPNLIVFQFNPETVRHAFTQAQPVTSGSNPLAVQGMPGETFSFTLAMDVSDRITDVNPLLAADAQANGIYSRLAALELLMFPVDASPSMQGSGAATAGAAEASAAGGDNRSVPTAQLPTILFFWGPGRFVPVRIVSLTITEKLFDELLNPTHAEAQIELRVLTPTELKSVTGPLQKIANGAYEYTMHRREVLAIVNLNNAAGSIELPPIVGG